MINIQIQHYPTKSERKSVNRIKTIKGTILTTNNSTTFLQAINADCPSVLILLGRQKMIREISRETFALLEEVGIVFTDIQLAINHINIISRNPEEWWRSDAVQKAKSAFCLQHTNTSKNAINKLFKLFN